MRKLLTGGIAIAAVLSASVAGYRLGSGKWPDPRTWTATSAPEAIAMPAAAPKERKVLYWKHPDNDTDFAAEPKKTGDGRVYVAIYDDQEADFAQARPKEPPLAAGGGPKKLLYYRNPMGMPDTSPMPKKDWMGMDYIPVYEGEEDEPGTVKVSVAKLQNAGVRSEPAVMRRLVRPIRSPGVAKPDERTLLTVALRADSFIERLYVNETGRHVKKGEPLFRVYNICQCRWPARRSRRPAAAAELANSRGCVGRTQAHTRARHLVRLAVSRLRRRNAEEGHRGHDDEGRRRDVAPCRSLLDLGHRRCARAGHRPGPRRCQSESVVPRVPERGLRRARDLHPA
jgi:hypothetical protein